MIACEALPHDAAMLSRAVICTLDPLAKQEQQSFDKNRLYALAADAGVVLLRGFDAKAEMRILVAADAAASGLKQLDERQKYQVWGPVLGSLKVLMELAKVEPADSADVMQHAMAYCREEVMTHSGRGWGEAFFEDLLEMFQADRLKDAHRYFKLDKSGAVLWLNLSGLFTQWHEYRARQARGTFLASVDLRRDLKSLRWVMFPKDQKKIRVGEKTVNAVGVKLDVAPEYVKQLARSV